MKKIIIIHGMPEKNEYLNLDGSINLESKKHWLPWLKAKLEDQGLKVIALDMPIPYNPEYTAWKQELDKHTIDEETTLVGHSLGAGFIIRYLSEEKIKVDKAGLVAPWLDLEKELKSDFLDFKIDNRLLDKSEDLRIFYSLDDDPEILSSVAELKKAILDIKDKIIEFSDRGHFAMGTYEFPELLNYLLD